MHLTQRRHRNISSRKHCIKCALKRQKRICTLGNFSYLLSFQLISTLLTFKNIFMFFRFEGDGCHVAVVDGRYSYHHYMQDNFDDNVSAGVSCSLIFLITVHVNLVSCSESVNNCHQHFFLLSQLVMITSLDKVSTTSNIQSCYCCQTCCKVNVVPNNPMEFFVTFFLYHNDWIRPDTV